MFVLIGLLNSKVLVVAAGVTLDEALKAAQTLEASGVNVRVLDPFTIKPLDAEGVIKNALECGGRIVTVEDHYPEVNILYITCKELRH